MERTAGSFGSSLSMNSTLNPQRRALLPAVAHLVLVRRMISRVIIILALVATMSGAAEPWQASQFVVYSKPEKFYLTTWGHDGKTLYAEFTYAAIPKSHHPMLSLQIAQSWQGPWKTVARVRADREVLQSGARGDASRLRVTLDAFEPHLRSHKAGRVVLGTGDAATISLCKLLHESTPGCDE